MLTEPALVVDDVDDHAEEVVEQLDDLARRPLVGQLGRADQVDEQHGDVELLAAERDAALQRLARDVLADLAAEEVAEALALAQPVDHAVEPGLQQPDLAAVVDVDVRAVVAVLQPAHRAAQALQRIGERPRGEGHDGQADDQRDAAEQQRRGGDAVRGGVQDAGQHAGADERDAQHRHAGAQDVGQQDPRRDARQLGPLGHVVGQGPRRTGRRTRWASR